MIDDKLRKLEFYNPGVARWLKLSDDDIKQIKQAFIDAGWSNLFPTDKEKYEAMKKLIADEKEQR